MFQGQQVIGEEVQVAYAITQQPPTAPPPRNPDT